MIILYSSSIGSNLNFRLIQCKYVDWFSIKQSSFRKTCHIFAGKPCERFIHCLNLILYTLHRQWGHLGGRSVYPGNSYYRSHLLFSFKIRICLKGGQKLSLRVKLLAYMYLHTEGVQIQNNSLFLLPTTPPPAPIPDSKEITSRSQAHSTVENGGKCSVIYFHTRKP